MQVDCIPAGMELFPAADEEQFAFIKKVIDDCDYYLLIIGGRYGSITPDGVSYTEMEYDYAVEKRLKVLAFLHRDPAQIPAGKTDIDRDAQRKLATFREKVSKGRLVQFWEHANELPGLVALGISHAIKTYPAVGWVRSSAAGSFELLQQLNDLRIENTDLEAKVMELSKNASLAPKAELAWGDDVFQFEGKFKSELRESSRGWKQSMTWNQFTKLVGPHLFDAKEQGSLKGYMARQILEATGHSVYEASLSEQCFQTIKVQFLAVGLITAEYTSTLGGGAATFWQLTDQGKRFVLELRTLKKAPT